MNKITIRFIALSILTSCLFSSGAAQKREPQKNLREVKIYLVREVSEPGDRDRYDSQNPGNFFPVTRRVDSADPLRNALRVLMRGATEAEEKRGLSSGTFGIRFVSVRLKNGTALARFTMPETATFGGTNSPLYFIDAVTRTALQFPAVKKVVVCLDGTPDFGLEDDTLPRRKC